MYKVRTPSVPLYLQYSWVTRGDVVCLPSAQFAEEAIKRWLLESTNELS